MKHMLLKIFSIFALIVCFSSHTLADPPGKEKFTKKQIEKEHENRKLFVENDRGSRKQHEEIRREENKHRETVRGKYPNHYRDYSGHPGYRVRPYAENRHYVQYVYGGHHFDYHGHWRSWGEWDRYARTHKTIVEYGKYYREGTHLMFRYCEPGTDNCVFFSIGR